MNLDGIKNFLIKPVKIPFSGASIKSFFTKPVSFNFSKESIVAFLKSDPRDIFKPKPTPEQQKQQVEARPKVSIGTIWLYNTFSNSFYKLSSDGISKTAPAQATKEPCASFLGVEDLTVDTLEINRFIPTNEQAEAVEVKAYDELALEPTLEYKFVFVDLPEDERAQHEQNKKVDVFIANTVQLESKFTALRESCRYIDFIGYAPLCIGSLYANKLLNDDGVHAFVYFYDNNSFLCVYKDGKFLYSKAIKLTLKSLYERFIELLGDRVQYDDFCDRLTNATLSQKNLEAPLAESKLFSEIFTAIADILMHAKRVHAIDRYSGIYIACEYGSISNASEMAKLYLETPVRNFEFTTGLEPQGFVDIMTQLLGLSAIAYMATPNDAQNFSIFKRPPPLMQRDAGRALALTAIGVAVAFVYPIFELTVYNGWLKYKASNLSAEYSTLHSKRSADEQKVLALSKEKEKVQKEIALQDALFAKQNGMLNSIFAVKNDYASRAGRLIDVFELLSKYDVKLVSIDMNGTDSKLECKASATYKITGFLRQVGHLDMYSVKSDGIQKDANLSVFFSTVTLKYLR